MRIIALLACATTHALIAQQRRQPAQTVRKVKIDTDTLYNAPEDAAPAKKASAKKAVAKKPAARKAAAKKPAAKK